MAGSNISRARFSFMLLYVHILCVKALLIMLPENLYYFDKGGCSVRCETRKQRNTASHNRRGTSESTIDPTTTAAVQMAAPKKRLASLVW